MFPQNPLSPHRPLWNYSADVLYCVQKLVTVQHPGNQGQNLNGKLAYRADFAPDFQVAKARSASGHRQRRRLRLARNELSETRAAQGCEATRVWGAE